MNFSAQRLLFLLSLAALPFALLQAATVQENFSGTVVSAQEELGLGGIFNSPIGTPVTGFFKFDTSAAIPDSGNGPGKATYTLGAGSVTMSASDPFGSFTLSNPVVTSTVALEAMAGQNGWEIYLPRNPSDEPISRYFDVGLGTPLNGPVQIATPIPADGTVSTTALSFFPTTFAPGTIGFSQFAVVNDPSNRFDYVDIDITSLGSATATPEPASFGLVGVAVLLGIGFKLHGGK
jgi:hypothetical protein